MYSSSSPEKLSASAMLLRLDVQKGEEDFHEEGMDVCEDR